MLTTALPTLAIILVIAIVVLNQGSCAHTHEHAFFLQGLVAPSFCSKTDQMQQDRFLRRDGRPETLEHFRRGEPTNWPTANIWRSSCLNNFLRLECWAVAFCCHNFFAVTTKWTQRKKSEGKIIFSFSPFQKKISALTRRFRNRHCSRCQRFELRHWKLFLHWNSYSWVEKGTKRSYYLEMKIWQANLD